MKNRDQGRTSGLRATAPLVAALLAVVAGSAHGQARVLPQLDCIDAEMRETGPGDPPSAAGPWVTAHLGYISEFTAPVTIPVGGSDNFFTPGFPDRGQPGVFQPGIHEDLFTVVFNATRISTLSWRLSAENVDENGDGSPDGGPGMSLRITHDPADYCDPTIDAVSPATGMQGELLELTLTGGPFASGYRVRVRQGNFALDGSTVDTELSSLSAEFLIPSVAPLGFYDVEVIDLDGDIVTRPASFELLGSLEINALAMAADGSAIYAGTAALGIFKSTDGGANWQAVNNGLDDLRVRSLLADPNDPLVLYAGTREGIFKTVDGGASWTAMNAGLPSPGP